MRFKADALRRNPQKLREWARARMRRLRATPEGREKNRLYAEQYRKWWKTVLAGR